MTPEQLNELAALKAALKQHIDEAEKATPGSWTAQMVDVLDVDMWPLTCRIALIAIKALEEINAADDEERMGADSDLRYILSIWKGGQP